MKALEHHLRQLRLPHLAAALPRALEQAGTEGWSHEQFLSTLLEQEAFGREQSGIQMRLKQSRFPAVKTLEDFNFTLQASVKKTLLLHLASNRYIEARENVIFLGPPGTGKTHLAIALGVKACQAGYHVRFCSAVDLVQELLEAQRTRTLNAALARLDKPAVLICDELGYIPLEQDAASLFFQVVSRRYERGSLILTSNRPFGSWGMIFGDTTAAAAIIDRLIHHAEIIALKGSSFRTRGKEQAIPSTVPPAQETH